MTKRDATKLEVFLHTYGLSWKMYWPMKYQMRRFESGLTSVPAESKSAWQVHQSRSQNGANKHPKTALTWAPEGRSRSSPKQTGEEPQEKKEQHWVLAHGTKQQWLLVTV